MGTARSMDSTEIDYDIYGEDGPVVVFVAGAVQHRVIDPNTTAAAKLLGGSGFTTIVYDRRGRGRSGDTPPWAVEREVEDVAALVAAGGGTATLYSSSAGAAVVLAAAVADVGVTGLVLYEPPFFSGADKAAQIQAVEELLAEGHNDAVMRYNMTDIIGVPADVVDTMTTTPSWPAMCAVAPTLIYDLSAVNAVNTDPDWAARWAKVAVPVSVYSGAESFPALSGAADRVAAALPGAVRRSLEGQDHGPSAEAIADAVRQFHRDHDDDTRG